MANITIIGGHGKVALLAEPMLTKHLHTVNAIIRSEDQAEDVKAAGANPVVADITALSTEEMAQLFKDLNTEVLVWSAGAGGVGGPERTYAIDRDAAIRSMEAAQNADIRRYIMVSYLGAGTEHGVPESDPFYAYAESKAEADQHLRGTSLDYTILGPGMLTTEDEGGITVGVDPLYHSGLSSNTSRATVARVLTEVIDDSTTIGKAIPFTDGQTDIRLALVSAPNTAQLR